MYGMHPDKLALGFDPDHLPSGGTHMDTYGLVQCQFCHPGVSFNPYGSGAIRFCENCHTIQLLHGNSEHMETNNIYTVNGIPNQQVTANEKCAACHHHTDHTIDFSVGQIIAYTGHLDKTPNGVLADTLITVTHGRKSDIKAKIAVYDRSGNKIAESSFLDGGEKLANSFIPQESLGWIALGMIVNQATLNPTGSPGMEIFSFKILVGKSGGILRPVVVGVKEIVYHSRQENTGKAIWNTTQIASWSNTVLGGGQPGTAIVKHNE
ncbi:MAG: hypothetical protein JRF37_08555 [Deltaproteobacteria bacterium]|nr:hypothetical protein [Deltaproteobacteria bacterium]